MKVSLNTVRQYVNFDLPPVDELVSRINQQLGGVEEVIDLTKKYQGITIVKVVECAPLEGTDHLNLTKVDDDGVTDGVERDENGLVQVVCGAPNVRAGMFAVWLAPGRTVPASFDDAEPFVLGAKELRGVVSNGMLASPKELALGDDHDGILEIQPDEISLTDTEIKPGTDFAAAFGLNDTIIDIENKMFTHRPDLFGQLGVAREIAGILGHKFTSPPKYLDTPQFENGTGLRLEVTNEIPDKVPRFMALAVKNVEVKSSPLWLKCELVRMGGKPINNVVDVTNYIMLQTAQPVHAYDYDKVATGKLGVRTAHDGEKLTLLGGKVVELTDADIVITDGEKAIGLGGVMGGQDTEVSNETRNLILECANFDMFTIRRTSMRHGLFTDAATRFTKGQSPLQNDRVMLDLFKSIATVTGGEPASDVIDLGSNNDEHVQSPLGVTEKFINERLGLRLDSGQIAALLENVEFKVKNDEDGLDILMPFWRMDIEIPEDIVEEVGRLYGFDKLPQELPLRTLKPAPVNPRIKLKQRVRDILSRAGANEVLTYSFVHRSLLQKVNQRIDATYQLSNALSPDLHYYRLSVLPSLMEKIHMNEKAGYDTFALFEIGKGHDKFAEPDEQGVPVEDEFVSLALAGGDFYQAKALLEFMANKLNLSFDYRPLTAGAFLEPKRSAGIVCQNMTIGIVGEYRASVRRSLKLPDVSAGFEIDFDLLMAAVSEAKETYRPLSRFPSVERDVTFQVSDTTAYIDVRRAVEEALASSDLETDVDPVAIYKPESGDTKNITFHVRLTSHDRTLTSDEANAVMVKISEHAETIGAKVV